MPPQPGEELLLTVFADVHYYVKAPGSKPQHDRFSRGSYVYLFYNPIQRRGRLEVANHAGTPEQDAFSGHLDTIILAFAQKQPNLVTVTVDGIPAKPASPQANDQSLWTLPIHDMRREQKYLYKLHTLDLYFWTAEDAGKFVDASRRVLTEQQLRLDIPAPRQTSVSHSAHSEHQDAHHPVIQQLEQAAITDPYRPRADTTSTAQSVIPGRESRSSNQNSSTSATPATAPAPAPYNPAAPSKPEPIAHREKTPPPPEAVGGTGLAAAAVMDQPNLQYAQQTQQTGYHQQAFTPPQSYFPAQSQGGASGSFPPPPPGSPPTSLSHPQTPSAFPGPPQPQRQSSVPTTQYATIPQQPYGSPMQSPQYNQYTPVHTPGYSSQQTPTGFPPPPPGGPPSAGMPPSNFSNYTYSSGPQTGRPQQQDLAVHQQFYRPTEAEVAPGGHIGSHASLTAALGQQGPQAQAQQQANATGVNKPGRFDDRIGRVEKGVNKWLKKLDQKI
ncbi:hypothetical protein BDZ85DRAFT_112969 [Elsinoe ampelina]|uniref:RNA recognition motif-containing protein n=1 Tax=Elsinoe ampelina TaxID=302913 RepID=A0A6A6GDL1_9PEZI|nr:hypothetical protein BDZ85DRAFT_112969 [Elsinoe ampelina]